MTEQSSVELVVMRRVRLIRLLALIISTATLTTLTFAAALWGIGREVWVAQILQNMPPASDPTAFTSFWLAAFGQAALVVQSLTLLTLTSLIFLAREIAKTLVPLLTPNQD